MTKKQKLAALLGKIAAAPAIFLLMLFAVSTTAYAQDYELYIGSTRVTDANAGNIFNETDTKGNPTAKYDAGTKTLTLNGVHIGADNYYEVLGDESSPTNHYSMYAGKDVVKHLEINGDNSFVSAGSEKVYYYKAKVTDEWDCTEDSNGDGIINREDMTPSQITPVCLAEGGIHFKATGREGNTFTITGSGTLTSTATEGYCHDYNETDGELLGEDGCRRAENLGTALTIAGNGWVYMGNEDGTGPKLELTGWDVGADFRSVNKFDMQGGTVIAKATSTTKGTGVYLSKGAGVENYFNGGTIAAYGIADPNDTYKESGAFPSIDGKFEDQISKNHGMQRVYPATLENDETDIYDDTRPIKIREISGWAVVGMTSTAPRGDGVPTDKERTDAVLAELGLDGSGGGTGEGTDNRYHTDTVPDSGPDNIDVLGFTKDAIIYSVDVEWGAMTFEYEASSWDPKAHKQIKGRGWLVYDNVAGEALTATQDAINKVTITNHSNAAVKAQLSYAPETTDADYSSITGTFNKSNVTPAEDVKATWTATDATNNSTGYFELKTAATDEKDREITDPKNTAGTPAVGNIYFMPSGIGTTDGKVNDITQWKKIGKITVGIRTVPPTQP